MEVGDKTIENVREIVVEPEEQAFRARYSLRGGKLFALLAVFVVLATICVARKKIFEVECHSFIHTYILFCFVSLFSFDLEPQQLIIKRKRERHSYIHTYTYFILMNAVYEAHWVQLRQWNEVSVLKASLPKLSVTGRVADCLGQQKRRLAVVAGSKGDLLLCALLPVQLPRFPPKRALQWPLPAPWIIW
jgi:hypothetical protein